MHKTPQSILKKPSNDSSLLPVSVLTREERNRETALHHARLIQQRKDIEAQILKSIEALLESPSDPLADPAKPTPFDTFTFKTHLTNFQPSDYDAVIEERNIENLCGYPLCPRARQKQDSKAKFRIIRQAKRGEELLVIPKEKLEQWCSDDCARRSMYVRTQLNEEPAWLRSATLNGDIILLNEAEDPTRPDLQQITSGMDEMEIDSKNRLALERGELPSSGQKMGGDIKIREKKKQDISIAYPPSFASLDMPDLAHLSIEGHTTKQKYGQNIERGEMMDGGEDAD